MRTQSHVIDTKAVKRVLNLLPDHWVVRELTERDYGIDLMVEIFILGPEDKMGKIAYDSSGAILHIQVKGTLKAVRTSNSGTINFSMEKSSLKYVEKFSVPFLLFRVDLSSELDKCYFVWLQRYVKDVLDIENPTWRETSQKSLTIRIPKENKVSERIERVEEIALRPKFLEELLEYCELYGDLSSRFASMLSKNYPYNHESISEFSAIARRIQRFNVLLTQNPCCVSHTCLGELITFIEKAHPSTTEFDDFPNKFNLDLLFNSFDSLMSVEAFVLENAGYTAY